MHGSLYPSEILYHHCVFQPRFYGSWATVNLHCVMSTHVLVILCGQLKRNTLTLPTSSTGDRPILSHGNEGPTEDPIP